MPTKKEDLEKIVKLWNQIVDNQQEELATQTSELEISALYACLGDCFEGTMEIYADLIPKLETIPMDDYENLHEYVCEIYFGLDHIKKHIIASEKGFLSLMKILAKKAEIKES